MLFGSCVTNCSMSTRSATTPPRRRSTGRPACRLLPIRIKPEDLSQHGSFPGTVLPSPRVKVLGVRPSCMDPSICRWRAQASRVRLRPSTERDRHLSGSITSGNRRRQGEKPMKADAWLIASRRPRDRVSRTFTDSPSSKRFMVHKLLIEQVKLPTERLARDLLKLLEKQGHSVRFQE